VYLLSFYATRSPTGILLARLMTTAFSLGCVFLVHSIGKRVSGDIAGLISALLLGINPFFALYSFFVRMEIPMVFSMLLGLLLIVKGKHSGSLLGAGIALAAAALFKEFALLFTVVCGMHVLLQFRQSNLAWKAPLLVITPTVIAFLLWGIGCWRLSPSIFISTMHRWMGSAVGIGLGDPRESIGVIQWARQITFDLLDLGLVLGLILVVIGTSIRKMTLLSYTLLGYLILAVGLSFAIRLKELRHLVGILPVAALFIGVSVNWDKLWGRMRSSRLRGIAAVLVTMVILFFASPLRLPLRDVANLKAWFDPLYAWRVFESDHYYNVLRLTGLYLQEHTEPEEVITVVHEATVTAYYANRHYNMLYTAPMESVMQILEQTRYLVWDNTVFLALTEDQIRTVQEYVAQHFGVEQVIQDEHRQVTIYSRRDAQ